MSGSLSSDDWLAVFLLRFGFEGYEIATRDLEGKEFKAMIALWEETKMALTAEGWNEYCQKFRVAAREYRQQEFDMRTNREVLIR